MAMLRTADAAAPVSVGAVTTTLLIFFAVYNVLLLAFFWFAARIALKGPADSSAADAASIRASTGPTQVFSDRSEMPRRSGRGAEQAGA